MKKIHLFGIAMLAVFAFGALTVASASAAPVFLLAEWLVNGGAVTALTAVDAEGELLLAETILGIRIEALCSGILDGSIDPNGVLTITELLSLAGAAVAQTLGTTTAIACTNTANCTEPLAIAQDLPWTATLDLIEETGLPNPSFALLLTTGTGAAPGYEVECMGSGTSDLCVGESAQKVTNEGTNVDVMFEDAFNELAGFFQANCNTAGARTGLVEGLGTLLLTGGGTLAVSSEG